MDGIKRGVGDTGSVVRSGRRTCIVDWDEIQAQNCHTVIGRICLFGGYKYNLWKLLPSYCMWGCGCFCWSLEIWIFLGSSQLGGKRVREEIHYGCKQSRKGKGRRCIWMAVTREVYCIMSFMQIQKNLTTGYKELGGDFLREMGPTNSWQYWPFDLTTGATGTSGCFLQNSYI